MSALTVSWPTFQSGTDPSEVNQAFCNRSLPGMDLPIPSQQKNNEWAVVSAIHGDLDIQNAKFRTCLSQRTSQENGFWNAVAKK